LIEICSGSAKSKTNLVMIFENNIISNIVKETWVNEIESQSS